MYCTSHCQLLQLAWSHDNGRFLIVGNGRNSSVVVYDITYDKGSPRLTEAWAVKAGGKCVDGREEEVTKSESDSKDCGLDYHYGDAFYMAEINPSGNVFAVEERPHRTTLAHLYSPSGSPIKTRELIVPGHSVNPVTAGSDQSAAGSDQSAAGSDQSAAGGTDRLAVQTLLISTYKDGIYALVVQGGYVIIVDAEKLTITNSFKVVSTTTSVACNTSMMAVLFLIS